MYPPVEPFIAARMLVETKNGKISFVADLPCQRGFRLIPASSPLLADNPIVSAPSLAGP